MRIFPSNILIYHEFRSQSERVTYGLTIKATSKSVNSFLLHSRMNLNVDIVDESESHREVFFAFIAFFLYVMELDGIEVVVDTFPIYQCKDTYKY